MLRGPFKKALEFITPEGVGYGRSGKQRESQKEGYKKLSRALLGDYRRDPIESFRERWLQASGNTRYPGTIGFRETENPIGSPTLESRFRSDESQLLRLDRL